MRSVGGRSQGGLSHVGALARTAGPQPPPTRVKPPRVLFFAEVTGQDHREQAHRARGTWVSSEGDSGRASSSRGLRERLLDLSRISEWREAPGHQQVPPMFTTNVWTSLLELDPVSVVPWEQSLRTTVSGKRCKRGWGGRGSRRTKCFSSSCLLLSVLLKSVHVLGQR